MPPDSPTHINPDAPEPARAKATRSKGATSAAQRLNTTNTRPRTSIPAALTTATPQVVSVAPLLEDAGRYLPADELPRIRAAYRLADEAHLGQFRKSGEPYISHPLAVAQMLAGWRLDATTLMAALLHDTMEDKGISKHELMEKFGAEVAELVDGVSKLDRIQFSSKQEQQAESFRKMLLAMARDVRVILVKLADRLHNMRTMDSMAPESARRIARETLEIYVPIAHRLGLNELYRELQELSFATEHPRRHAVLKRAINAARGNRRELVSKVTEAVKTTLPAYGLHAHIHGREKTLYGIYRKMVSEKKSFSQVLDIYGFRLVVGTREQCYLALGALHQLYKPIPGKFKDYIAIPKVNGYQSLHTTLVGPFGTPVEFQIRSEEMHRVAEKGVAAHWLYKEDGVTLNDLQKRTHQWLQSLLDIQSQNGDALEFIETVKVDLLADAVYVFTPKGSIKSLPRGATPIDFAYTIHTDVGHRAVSARINGAAVPLRQPLRSGDVIEIVTDPSSKPQASWLAFARTGKARSEIRHYLRTMKFDDSVALGSNMLEQSLKHLQVPVPRDDDPRWDKLVRQSGAQNREEILADIGLGKRLAAVVALQFTQDAAQESLDQTQEPDKKADERIVIHGTEGLAVQLAPCCTPIPGDAIMGLIRTGHGLVVHTDDCPTARRLREREPEQWMDLQWAASADRDQSSEAARMFNMRIDLLVYNGRGVLGQVAGAIAQADSNIVNLTTQDDDALNSTLHFTIQVADRTHLARVLRIVRSVGVVQRVTRVKS